MIGNFDVIADEKCDITIGGKRSGVRGIMGTLESQKRQ